MCVIVSPLCLFPLLSGSSHIRVYLPPIDSGTPNTYCSKALEFQAPLVFNEMFRIPVHSSMLTLKSLQLYVCSVNQQLQEELLVCPPPTPPFPVPPSFLCVPLSLCLSHPFWSFFVFHSCHSIFCPSFILCFCLVFLPVSSLSPSLPSFPSSLPLLPSSPLPPFLFPMIGCLEIVIMLGDLCSREYRRGFVLPGMLYFKYIISTNTCKTSISPPFSGEGTK